MNIAVDFLSSRGFSNLPSLEGVQTPSKNLLNRPEGRL